MLHPSLMMAPPPAYAAPAGGDQFAELDDDDGELPF